MAAADTETVYYRISGHGRTALKAKTDAEAIKLAKGFDEKWNTAVHGNGTLRIVRSVNTVVWRKDDGKS